MESIPRPPFDRLTFSSHSHAHVPAYIATGGIQSTPSAMPPHPRPRPRAAAAALQRQLLQQPLLPLLLLLLVILQLAARSAARPLSPSQQRQRQQQQWERPLLPPAFILPWANKNVRAYPPTLFLDEGRSTQTLFTTSPTNPEITRIHYSRPPAPALSVRLLQLAAPRRGAVATTTAAAAPPSGQRPREARQRQPQRRRRESSSSKSG